MLLPELQPLARLLEQAGLGDRDVYARVVDRLRTYQDRERERDEPELELYLAAIAQLMELLAGPEESWGRREVRAIACGLLDLLQDGEEASGSSTADPPSAAQAPDTRNEAGTELAAPALTSEEGTPEAEAFPAAETPSTVAPPEAPCAAPQVDEETVEPAAGIERKQDMVLGLMLLELGHVNRKQIADALRIHRKNGPRLGECLLMQGAISPDRLLQVLSLQERLRATAEGITPQGLAAAVDGVEHEDGFSPASTNERPPNAALLVTERMFLGEVLLGAEMITNEQLEKALHIHYHEGLRVGEALVRIGALTEDEVESGLALQRSLCHIAGLAPA